MYVYIYVYILLPEGTSVFCAFLSLFLATFVCIIALHLLLLDLLMDLC